MIKRLVLIFIILLGSVLFAQQILTSSGYVSIEYSGWHIGLPLWFAAAGLFVIFLALYALLRSFALLGSLSGRLQRWRRRSRERHAHSLSTRGLIEFSEGNWTNAEKHLTRAVQRGENPLVNYLAAAGAAQEQGATSRRDKYLQKAQKAMPDAKVAVGLSQAQLQIASGQLEQALATLRHLHQLAPRHAHVLKLLQQVYVQCHDWQSLVDLLPQLQRGGVLEADELSRLETLAYSGLLETSSNLHELAYLEKTWHNIPRKVRAQAELVATYAECLLEHQAADKAEEVVYNSLYYKADEELFDIYGRIESKYPDKQLARAEKWLYKNPNHATLLLCLGRLCIRNQLWGKAKTYLENSLAARPSTETYATLARLCEQLGDSEQASQYYRQGLCTLIDDPLLLPKDSSS